MTDEQLEKAIKCWTGTIVSDEECMACPYGDKCTLEEIANEIIHRWRECKAENAVLRERLEKAVLNRCIYYLASIWNDATMTRRKEVRCRTVDYICDKFVQCNGLVLNWDEIYFTSEAAEARLAEQKGGENEQHNVKI